MWRGGNDSILTRVSCRVVYKQWHIDTSLAFWVYITKPYPSDIPYIAVSKCSLRQTVDALSFHPLSNPFTAPSKIVLHSSCPFFATFSISSCAFLTSSGRTFLPTSSFRSLFWQSPLAVRTARPAASHAFLAVAWTCARDSAVGGGMGTFSCKGFSLSG